MCQKLLTLNLFSLYNFYSCTAEVWYSTYMCGNLKLSVDSVMTIQERNQTNLNIYKHFYIVTNTCSCVSWILQWPVPPPSCNLFLDIVSHHPMACANHNQNLAAMRFSTWTMSREPESFSRVHPSEKMKWNFKQQCMSSGWVSVHVIISSEWVVCWWAVDCTAWKKACSS